MIMEIGEYKQYIKNKKIGVIGLGRSNMPLIELLLGYGAQVVACDRKEDIGTAAEKLLNMGATLHLGEGYLDGLEVEILFRTPGIRPDLPQIEQLKRKGTIITSEMDLFFELCPCEIFGVTGSDGKTTTTTLIYELLQSAGYTCHLGGNIGRPLIGDIEKIKPEDKVVVELSSFQLFDMTHSPKVAVITNITPNHLDWHKNVEEYTDAKKNIMKFQGVGDRLIVNLDNIPTREIGKEAKGEHLQISFNEKADIYCDGEAIYAKGRRVLETADIRIVGKHNVYNYMTAIGATLGYVSDEDIYAVATKFNGVEHRIELVRTLDGVKYYNSSIDSSPNRTKNTLSVFDHNVVLIAGGKDKGIPYDDVGAPIVEKVKVLILTGKTADKIEEAVRMAGGNNIPEIIRAATYKEAVNTAREKAREGDVVLLSPASTSFDMFNNFEERGNLFKKLVCEL
ncbi:MAG: UDP-N-acetylmuramoyl-L-alanine--D-glutamate ligase [Bacillota bacterium]|nr:UDP-N-acetylmuramoyl-L-alanine--D-glutamate ligase [Bacillota bacterium]